MSEDDKPAIPLDAVMQVCGMALNRLNEIIQSEIEKDRARLAAGIDVFEEVWLRAYWNRYVKVMLRASTSMAEYETDAGKLNLVEDVYGEELGLRRPLVADDVKRHAEFFKEKIAHEYIKQIETLIAKHEISSPVEQLFIVQWRYLDASRRYKLTLSPQEMVETEAGRFTVDFVVRSPDREPVAIEIDGHDFHEKTKEQVASDKRRERAIVKKGFKLLRFTGSEITRNPRACVADVVELAIGAPMK
ncbi:MAG: hypothetical protein FD152_2193 [Xanthobacteraceae bacterium]|nr:MAG: hypothetical protein FD152_2193 [Xanthobacteraceae bacterium]